MLDWKDAVADSGDWLSAFIGRGSEIDVPVREMPRIYAALKVPPGVTDLVFVTDAPSHWFGRSLPATARFDQVPRTLRPKVPKAIQKEALEDASRLLLDL